MRVEDCKNEDEILLGRRLPEGFDKLMEKACRRALSRALMQMKKDAKAIVRSKYPGLMRRSPKSKYQDTIASAIRSDKPRKNGDVWAGKLRIGQNYKKGSGSFRMIMYEQGVRPRHVRRYKGRRYSKGAGPYRGTLKKAPLWIIPGVESRASHYNQLMNEDIDAAVR